MLNRSLKRSVLFVRCVATGYVPIRSITNFPNGLPPSDPKDAIRQQLEMDPNLEGFFDSQDIEGIKNQRPTNNNSYDPTDPSDIPVYDELGHRVNDVENLNDRQVTVKFESHTKHNDKIEKDITKFKKFIHDGDIPDLCNVPNNLKLSSLVTNPLPLVFISKFSDPRLNLCIERYIYDNLPDPRKNIFAKRLFLYRNSPCIVLGKNQNPFKEINLHMADLYKIPILRRYSGGGTVVHDYGNVNFSFIASKKFFDRTGFTSILTSKLNSLIGMDLGDMETPHFELTTNDKGDMISSESMKKVSGSAFQLSRGRYLHHGTMLLNANLKLMSCLLKVGKDRKAGIIDHSIDSVPSPIENVRMDEELFEFACLDSFLTKFGVPSFLKRSKADNIANFKKGNLECQVIKLDDKNVLPKKVIDAYEKFCTWNWVFGHTPKFQVNMNLTDDLHIHMLVEQGIIKEIKLNRKEPLLQPLIAKMGEIPFRGDAIRNVINDGALTRALTWGVDQNIDYKSFGLTGL